MPETVLITGASSGIGREFAKLFAADGSRLVLTARRRPELEELAQELRDQFGVEVTVLPEDLAEPGAPKRLYDATRAADLEVDVLVNNAGFGYLDWFWLMSLEQQLDMIQVNVTALTELSWRFIRRMEQRDRGHILNVASTAAFVPGPHMAVYYATKAYVLSLSEALRAEHRRSGIRVTCLCPGPTNTAFADSSRMRNSWVFTQAMPVDQVARIGYRGFRRGKTIVVPGWLNKLSAILPRFTPRFLVRFVVDQLQPIPKEEENGEPATE